ncbi:distal tail protein Dit [Lacticaseibacillus hegangensis]|uniref:Distal tail protein Dit n=1 Tax=Lacticaseibacillus hegangensis TaxID=2486010 RepID=A0ABW4CZW1_9LACO|nr:distal tail protein Dit [Lacticaseibacillus hegangensis]
MAGISLNYNGVELSQWFDVTDVQRNIGTSHVNSMTKVGRTDGQLWQYMSRDTKTITISGIVTNANLANLRRDLGAALDVDEPKRLIIGDDIGVYYLAIYDGQPTIAEDWRSGTISLTFIVPDGIAHSVATETVTNTDGTDTVSFTNNGSYKSYPIVEVTMGGDNGYIGLASSSGGYLEFGNSNEIDGVQAASTETAFHWDMLSAPSQTTVNSGKINYVTYPYGSNPGPNTIAGSWDYAKAPDAATPVLNRTSSMHWAGPTIHGSIHANAAGVNTGNFYCANRMNIATNKTAVGRAEINLQSGNDIVVSFVIRDSSSTTDTLVVEGWAKGTILFAQNLDRRKFTNGAYNFEIKKAGDKLTFIISKIASISSAGIKNSAQLLFPFAIEGLADTSVDSITGWMAGFSNWNGWTANWSDSLFQWVNVDYWQDLPNRWTSGDVVMVDCINKRVLVNGVEDPTLQTIGNHWDEFCINPGENIIDVSTSSWATLPKVKINWKEAFV